MLLIPTLACFAVGVYLVVVAQRRPVQTEQLERIGGALVVVGLMGLGYMLASQR